MALDKFQPYLFVSAGEQSNKYLTPTITNGIAQFQAQRAQSITGLTVRIDPIQSGTGDPSPTNIRPISGRTGLTVTRAGKNLLAYPYTDTTKTNNGVTFTDNGDGSITLSGTATAQTDYLLESASNGVLPPNAQLLLSGGISDNIYVRCPIDSRTFTSRGADTALTTIDGNITGNCFIRALSGTNCNGVTVKPMIRVAGTSDTYEPHHGTNYPISWQTEAGTVYGGTLDVVSGTLTVEWDYIASYNGETLPGEWISDRDVYAEGTTPTTGAEVAYKLAEPVTYQLDPEQVMTVPGFNQVYNDAGPVIDIKF